jgi:hypothetical protein
MTGINFKVKQLYTLLNIGAMAISTQREIMITQNSEGLLKYRPNGKRKEYHLVVGFDELVFEGTDIPFMTDFEACAKGLTEHFDGNAMLNLFTELTIEEVRKFIEENNLNPQMDLGRIRINEVPVFPELVPSYTKQLTEK